jgi:hypothetical protein
VLYKVWAHRYPWYAHSISNDFQSYDIWNFFGHCKSKGRDDGWRITKKTTLTWIEKTTLTCYWKAMMTNMVSGWQIFWHHKERYGRLLTIKPTTTDDRSLKRLSWCEQRRLIWLVTENATLTCHWTDYSDLSLKRLHWRELKRLLWRVTEKATMTGDGSLKRLWWHALKRLLWYFTKKTMMMGDG